jgi:hypothetical protein
MFFASQLKEKPEIVIGVPGIVVATDAEASGEGTTLRGKDRVGSGYPTGFHAYGVDPYFLCAGGQRAMRMGKVESVVGFSLDVSRGFTLCGPVKIIARARRFGEDDLKPFLVEEFAPNEMLIGFLHRECTRFVVGSVFDACLRVIND